MKTVTLKERRDLVIKDRVLQTFYSISVSGDMSDRDIVYMIDRLNRDRKSLLLSDIENGLEAEKESHEP